MSKVYVTTYEIVGAGLALATDHYRRCDEARAAQWAFVEEVGGCGMRPDHFGGLMSVLFDELPKCWRKRGFNQGKVEGIPNSQSNYGKALVKHMKALPCAPRPCALGSALGHNPMEMAMDAATGRVFFTTDLRVFYPKERFFIRIPRYEGDGYVPDEAMLKAIPESTLMLAVETHNAEAARLRALEGEAA